MAGKRLLDVAALFNASRGVAQKHVALRSRQLDVYNRTSTLARAVKSQTDRVTETAKAASFLFGRLNENAPAWASEATDRTNDTATNGTGPIPSKESTQEAPTSAPKEGLEQDHFYEKSAGNSATDPAPEDGLDIQQEQADRYPLPDGTIPPAHSKIEKNRLDHDVISEKPKDELLKEPLHQDGLRLTSSTESTIPIPTRRPLSSQNARILQRQSEFQIPSQSADQVDNAAPDPLEAGHDEDSFYRKSKHTSPTLSSLPRVKLPGHTSDSQGGRESTGDINSDSFYENIDSVSIPSAEAVPEQEQRPEGINTDVFYSPRVAKILGGRTHDGKDGLKMEGARGTPIDHTKHGKGRDQDTFNVRSSSQKHPLDPSRNDPVPPSSPVHRQDAQGNAEMEELGQQLHTESTRIHEDVWLLGPYKRLLTDD